MFDRFSCGRKRRGAALPAAVQDANVFAMGFEICQAAWSRRSRDTTPFTSSGLVLSRHTDGHPGKNTADCKPAVLFLFIWHKALEIKKRLDARRNGVFYRSVIESKRMQNEETRFEAVGGNGAKRVRPNSSPPCRLQAGSTMRKE